VKQTDLIAFQHFGNVPNEPLGGEPGRRLDDARQALALGAALLAWLRRTFRRRRPSDAPPDFISRGALVLISHGIYSDFTVQSLVRARRDFFAKQEAANFALQHVKGDAAEQFGPWLEARGLVTALAHAELWLGSYSYRPDEVAEGLSVSWYD
jgi:hypothetical protein